MTAEERGEWRGGLLGGLFGWAGGIIGTYFSIKNTKGLRERVGVVRFAEVCGAAILVWIALILTWSDPYRAFLWILFVVLFPFGIIYTSKSMEYDRDRVDEMTLALMYLGMSRIPGGGRAWKVFDLQTLQRLHQKGWITEPKVKEVTLGVTAEGMKKAEELFKLHFGAK